LPPVKVEQLDAITARALGLTTAGWLLARPDGHPVALSNADLRHPEGLEHTIAVANGRTVPPSAAEWQSTSLPQPGRCIDRGRQEPSSARVWSVDGMS
jgi:hypothetical protein